MFDIPTSLQTPTRTKIISAYRMNEEECVNLLLANIKLSAEQKQRIEKQASLFVEGIRKKAFGNERIRFFHVGI